MTGSDPEEQDGAPGAARSGDESHNTDAAFDEIVAGWRAEPGAPRWPDDGDTAADAADETADGTRATGRAADAQRTHGGGRLPDGEDHFEPPEPPPLPTLRPRTVGALLLIGFGGFLLFAPGVLDLTQSVGTPLALLALAGGIGWLAFGLRAGPPPDSGWDDGAQL